MDRYEPGMLAKSKAGHDLQKIYIIFKVDNEYVYLVDGNRRAIDKPKRKNKKHIQIIKKPRPSIAEKLAAGQKVENEEIKRAIKKYTQEVGACQKPMLLK